MLQLPSWTSSHINGRLSLGRVQNRKPFALLSELPLYHTTPPWPHLSTLPLKNEAIVFNPTTCSFWALAGAVHKAIWLWRLKYKLWASSKQASLGRTCGQEERGVFLGLAPLLCACKFQFNEPPGHRWEALITGHLPVPSWCTRIRASSCCHWGNLGEVEELPPPPDKLKWAARLMSAYQLVERDDAKHCSLPHTRLNIVISLRETQTIILDWPLSIE